MACPAALKRKLTIEPISPGSAAAAFAPRVLRPFAICLPMAFKALVLAPTTAPIVMPAARKIDATVTPYFFEHLANPLSERQGSFSFFDLSLQPRELLVSFCYSCFCRFSVRWEDIFILDDCLVFFVLAPELAFSRGFVL